MYHFTCDLCGKELRAGEDRWVVKVEVFAARDPGELTEADLDADHLEAVAQLIRDLEDEGEPTPPADPASRRLRFDLCADCRARFLRDPLRKDGHAAPAKEPAPKLGFSEN
jgi:hypothetical protein